MVVRTAWIACTSALLSLSLSTANGPAGGFFVTRQQQQRSRQQLDGQVQQPWRQVIISRLLEKESREVRLGGLGRLASTAAAALGGGEGAQQQSRKTIEPATDSSYDSDHAAPVAAVVEQSQEAIQTTNTATYAGLGRQWRGLPSPLEALSSTGRQLSLRASATAAAWGVREGKPRSATILTRGGSAPAPQSPPPPQQGDRWKYAVEGLKNGLASGLAAACVKTVLQPFDTMKTVQQFSTTRWVGLCKNLHVSFPPGPFRIRKNMC